MEENKIIKRSSVAKANAFAKLSADFEELFEGFEGVSFIKNEAETDEDGTVTATESTVIYLDSNNYMYLKIVPDETYGVKITLNCGSGDTDGDNKLTVDAREKSENVAYNMVKTPYGAAFTTLPSVTDSITSISDSYFQNFFTVFEDENGNSKRGFVHITVPKDETSSSYYYICSEDHERLEKLSSAKIFLGSAASHTVLCNAVSYTRPLVANHLLKKLQSEDNKFGKIKLNGKSFIAGSHFCLECGEE